MSERIIRQQVSSGKTIDWLKVFDEPFALATDNRNGRECAVFWPTWSEKTKLPVRYVFQGKAGGRGRMKGRPCIVAVKHLSNFRPFHDKVCVFDWLCENVLNDIINLITTGIINGHHRPDHA